MLVLTFFTEKLIGKFLHLWISAFSVLRTKKHKFTPQSCATINRLLKKHKLAGRNHISFHPEKERKRFAYDKVNVLWQADLSHGPYIPINGKMKKTFLIAYIDDCSRLVPYAQFFISEKFDGLREVTKEALIRRGKPTLIYADNGKIYRSETLQYACAQLGITLAHTMPYDAPAKGKIERLFKTIQTRFYPLLKNDPVHSLEELNERFWQWLEEDYHRRPHASLDGKTPHEVFLSQLDHVTFLEDLSLLDSIFLKRAERKVKLDGTITLEKKLYEVPSQYIGQKIEIRMDGHKVYVFEDGKQAAEAVPVSMHDNAHVKRGQSPFAVSEGSQEKETGHV